VRILVEFLKLVDKKLEQKGMSRKNFKSFSAFFQMLVSGSNGEPLMTQTEITEGMRDSTMKVDSKHRNHLLVAGKVLHMYDLWNETNNNAKAGSGAAKRLVITNGTSPMLSYIELDGKRLLK
jgi:hypothetical protein